MSPAKRHAAIIVNNKNLLCIINFGVCVCVYVGVQVMT